MTHSPERRSFLTGAAAATAAAVTHISPVSAHDESDGREFYEWRRYQLADAGKHKLVSTYVETALQPALNRHGIDRVGVFTAADDNDLSALYLLIAYPTLAKWMKMNDTLASDKTYQAAAREFYAQPTKAPAYQRIENQFMRAFSGMPRLELPKETKSGAPRVFEWRKYESHNEATARLKVEMFDKGEIQIMRDVKLAPVFYGTTLIGNRVPNLTYMLAAPDMPAHKEHWKAFLKHPEWIRMKGLARYKGTVSKITNGFVVPTAYSQI
jgi:hypothetical protein